MIRLPRMGQESAVKPEGSLAEQTMLDLAQQAAMAEWRKQMDQMEGLVRRAEAALVLATDPMASPEQRKEALGHALHYKEALMEGFEQTQTHGKRQAADVFREMSPGVSGGVLRKALDRFLADLKAPEGMRSFNLQFAAKAELARDMLRHPEILSRRAEPEPVLVSRADFELTTPFSSPSPFGR